MQVGLVLLALCGLSVAAPQNWPYRDSLMPYRYGYPGQSQYKYLPQVEDDEDTGPYLSNLHGRQDLVVGSEGDRVKPTNEPGVSVIETGSVAPVVEPSKPTRAPSVVVASPTHKPVGVDTGRPVQPPPFPAARPPPTPPPSAKPDEEEEDDESEEDADDDVDPNADDDDADEEDDGDDADEEEEKEAEDDEEEERRRQEPLDIKTEKVVKPVVQVAPVVPVVPTTAVPVVPSAVVGKNKTVVVPVDSVEDVNGTSVDSKPVGEVEDDASSEEQGIGGIEALVPGYVTDEGEVLVPVDTVTGDQPIAIVPDPYGQPARGVALNRGPTYRGPYEEDDYETPYYYTDIPYGAIRRQDSDEVDPELDVISPTKGQGKVPVAGVEKNKIPVESVEEVSETDDEDVVSETSSTGKDKESLEAELEGRNEYMTAFPPSRTPELFALIKSRIPVDTSSEYEDYNYIQGPVGVGGYNGPYAYQQQQPRPYYSTPNQFYRQRPQHQSVSFAVALSAGGQQSYNNYNRRVPAQQPYYNPYDDYYQPQYRPVPSQFYRRPVPSVYRPGYPQVGQYVHNPGYPVHRPNPFYGYHQPSQFGGYEQPGSFGGYQPGPIGGGYNRPVYRPFVGGQSVHKKRPGVMVGNKHSGAVGYLRPTAVRITPVRKPTPVIKQKKQPVPVQVQDDSFEVHNVDSSSVGDVSSGGVDSFEQQLPPHWRGKTTGIAKTRRAPKMSKTKKPSKKLLEQPSKKTDADPLNILKKIHVNAKRS